MTTNLSELLIKRIEETKLSKKKSRESLDGIELKIKSLLSRIGPRPKEKSDDELAALLLAKEREHSTTSQTNADERQFMRDMEAIRKKRIILAEYQSKQIELDSLKEDASLLRDEIKVLDSNLDELFTGQRRLRACQMIGCTAQDLIEKKIQIPENRTANVIGKKGSSIKSIESETQVVLDIDRFGLVTITGTEKGVSEASARIELILDSEHEELSLSDKIIVCLLFNKTKRVQDLQSKHNVRLDISRVNNVCKVSGRSAGVAACKEEIMELQNICSSQKLKIDPNLFPTLIGRGGITISGIQEQFQVQIEVDKDDASVNLIGIKENVAESVKYMQSFASDNKEIEEKITMPRIILAVSILGTGGKILKEIQSRYMGIRFEIDRNETTTVNKNDNSAEGTIFLKGKASFVSSAKEEILNIVKKHRDQTLTINISSACIQALLEKNGTRIKDIRQKFPESSINVDVNSSAINIQCDNSAKRELIVMTLQEVIDENQVLEMLISRDITISLKGQKGSIIRNRISELDVKLLIDTDAEKVSLQGNKRNIEEASKELQEFVTCQFLIDFPVSDEDFNCITNPSSGSDGLSFCKEMERDHNVEILVFRKQRLVRVRGIKENVTLAVTAIQGFINGNYKGRSTLMKLPEAALSAFIGKQGANVKKFESTFVGVSMDILRSSGQLRIRGIDASIVREARKNALQRLDNIRLTQTIDLSNETNVKLSDHRKNEIISIVSRLFSVDVQFDIVDSGSSSSSSSSSTKESQDIDNNGSIGGMIKMRGPASHMEAAIQYVREQSSSWVNNSLPLCRYLYNQISSDEEMLLGPLRMQCNISTDKQADDPNKVEIKLSTANHKEGKEEVEGSDTGSEDLTVVTGMTSSPTCIMINGPIEKVESARLLFYRMLDTTFPGEFASVPMDHSCLGACSAPNKISEILEVCANDDLVIFPDMLFSCMRVMGDKYVVKQAVDLLREWRSKWVSRHARVDLEAFMIQLLLSNKGSKGATTAIENLQRTAGASLNIDRVGLKMGIEGETEEATQQALQIVSDYIKEIKDGFWLSDVQNEEVLMQLIGKGGANITKLRTETGASIDVLSKTKQIQITGTKETVNKAREVVENLIEDLRLASNTEMYSLPGVTGAALIIGKGGDTITQLQKSHKVKISIERTNNDRSIANMILKGHQECCTAALSSITSLLEENGMTAPIPISTMTDEEPEHNARHENAEQSDILSQGQTQSLLKAAPIGSSSAVAQNQQYKLLSASAQRRARRKAKNSNVKDSDSLNDTEAVQKKDIVADTSTTSHLVDDAHVDSTLIVSKDNDKSQASGKSGLNPIVDASLPSLGLVSSIPTSVVSGVDNDMTLFPPKPLMSVLNSSPIPGIASLSIDTSTSNHTPALVTTPSASLGVIGTPHARARTTSSPSAPPNAVKLSGKADGLLSLLIDPNVTVSTSATSRKSENDKLHLGKSAHVTSNDNGNGYYVSKKKNIRIRL